MTRTRILCLILLIAGLMLSQAVSRAGSTASTAVTFTKDIAPILYQHCVECHRPTGVAPMSLLEYKDARPWARSIKERVVDRSMPPWFADRKHGEFSNDPSLSQSAI